MRSLYIGTAKQVFSMIEYMSEAKALQKVDKLLIKNDGVTICLMN